MELETIEKQVKLTTPQRVRLAELEQTIETNMQAFYDIGEAMAEIRNSKLYRDEFKTFDEYVANKWGVARQHANRLMSSAKVLQNLDTTEEQRAGLRETHLRPLAPLEPEQQKQVFETAVATAPDGQLTQAHVQQAVDDSGFNARMKQRNGPVDWYTPEHIIEAAELVFDGTIDLDPASCESANTIVQASKFYSVEDDGLEKPWCGNVWINPPYDKVGPWVEKMIAEYETGNLKQGIMLVNANTETLWFRKLWPFSICFIAGRLSFWNPDKSGSVSAPHGNAAIYLGSNPGGFAVAFRQLGTVYSVNAGAIEHRQIHHYDPAVAA